MKLARAAGFLYLMLIPLGFFGILYVPSQLIVEGNATETANNILESESLFRFSILSALLVQVVNIFVVSALYKLLHSVNKDVASLMVIFIFLGVPIAMLNELNHVAILLVLDNTNALTPFSTDLVPFFFDLHEYGVHIAGIFWGLWLFPMGYLVFKSGFLPRIIGILLMIGCFGYLIDSFATLLFPDAGVEIAGFTFWGEILLPLWLLIKGVDPAKAKSVSATGPAAS
jgi:hypothetical protein